MTKINDLTNSLLSIFRIIFFNIKQRLFSLVTKENYYIVLKMRKKSFIEYAKANEPFFRAILLSIFVILMLYLIIPSIVPGLLFYNILSHIIIISLLTLIVFFIMPSAFKNLLRAIGFFITSYFYFISLFLWILFDRSTPKFQFLVNFGQIDFLNTEILFGIDGISLFFVILTTLITPLLFLSSWYLTSNVSLLSISIIIAELFTLLTFTSLDLFLFFFVFEALLLPLFISIINWGTSIRRIKAAMMLLIYTIISSILFSFAIFTLYLEVGTTNFFALLNYPLPIEKQMILWLALFFSFAIKVPVYPLHTWLPEAHVEAPTFGSVILASLLLKTGGYGIFRFVLPLFPDVHNYFVPLVYCLCSIGVVYAALSSLRQLDMKRIIAYLSVSHMNLCVLGQFSETLEGLLGSLLLMIAHGIIAAGFFISVGILYKRYHERLIIYFSGLARVMPTFAVLFFIFTLANMNMPGTSNFVGEVLILIGLGHKSLLVTIFSAVGSAIGALCTIWIWSRIMFGEIKYQFFNKIQDLSRKEFATLVILVIVNFFIGLNTNEFIETIYTSTYYLFTFIH